MQTFDTSRVGQRWILGTAAAIVLAACSGSAGPDSIRDPPTTSVDLRGTVVASDAGLPSDPIVIDSATVVGDTLTAAVSHGGGCANHAYQLVIAPVFMESFPVQVRGRIAHNANGDVCRALLRRELRMNLRPLAVAYRASYRQEHGSVLIQLPGPTQPLLYKF